MSESPRREEVPASAPGSGGEGAIANSTGAPAVPWGGFLALSWLLGATCLSAAWSPIPVASDPWPVAALILGFVLCASTSLFLPVKVGHCLHTGLGMVLLFSLALDLYPSPFPDLGINGKAGALVLFLPLWLDACLDRQRSGRARVAFGGLAALVAVLIFAGGSRGGGLAALLGILVVGTARLGLDRRSGDDKSSSGTSWAKSRGLAASRRGWFTLGAAVFAAGLGWVLLFPTTTERLAMRFLLEDRAQGLTLQSASNGRPGLWHQAATAWSDVPIFGLGPGRFGALVPPFYPGTRTSPTPQVDHAHQFLLQLGLDLGAFGTLGMLFLLASAVGNLQGRQGTRNALPGLAGSLTAFLVFGLVDTVPLGHPASWGSWTLLGLVLARSPAQGAVPAVDTILGDEPSPARSGDRLRHPARWGWIAGTILGPALGATLAVAWMAPGDSEAAARQALRALHDPDSNPPADALDALRGARREGSGNLWLEGWLHGAQGDPVGQLRAWTDLLDSSAERLPMVEAAMARNGFSGQDVIRLARRSVERWPGEGAAWLWLARALRSSEPRRATTAYLSALARRPNDGHAWLELAMLQLSLGNRGLASSALAQACYAGDPGANACGQAGRLAELTGHSEQAIELYCQSRWPPFRARAKELAVGLAGSSAGASVLGSDPCS